MKRFIEMYGFSIIMVLYIFTAWLCSKYSQSIIFGLYTIWGSYIVYGYFRQEIKTESEIKVMAILILAIIGAIIGFIGTITGKL